MHRYSRSEERRVGKECKRRLSSYQAEDGIRDTSVTGVQTCALPILIPTKIHANKVPIKIKKCHPLQMLKALEVENQTSLSSGALVAFLCARVVTHYSHYLSDAQIFKIGRASCR